MTKTWSLYFILFFTLNSLADIFHWPEVCSKGTLTILNNSHMEQKFFLQTFNPQLQSEQLLKVGPQEKLSLPINGRSENQPHLRLSLLSLNRQNQVQVSYKCLNQNYIASSKQSGEWTFSRNFRLSTHKLWLKNLSPDLTEFQIELINSNAPGNLTNSTNLTNSIVKSWTFTLNSYQQTALAIKEQNDWNQIRVISLDRLAVFYLNSSGNEIPIRTRPTLFKEKDLGGAYFEMQNRNSDQDSFVIFLADPVQILKARQLISNPNSEKIVVAEIAKGHKNHNRNLLSPDRAPWSWHVSRVTSFSDLASTACNGLPQIVQDRRDNWIQDPGRICFWGYRIKKEIDAKDL